MLILNFNIKSTPDFLITPRLQTLIVSGFGIIFLCPICNTSAVVVAGCRPFHEESGDGEQNSSDEHAESNTHSDDQQYA